jgi:hypothetical protein
MTTIPLTFPWFVLHILPCLTCGLSFSWSDHRTLFEMFDTGEDKAIVRAAASGWLPRRPSNSWTRKECGSGGQHCSWIQLAPEEEIDFDKTRWPAPKIHNPEQGSFDFPNSTANDGIGHANSNGGSGSGVKEEQQIIVDEAASENDNGVANQALFWRPAAQG